MVYQIVYTWQGERLHGPQVKTKKEAHKELAKFRADNWRAWIEKWN